MRRAKPSDTRNTPVAVPIDGQSLRGGIAAVVSRGGRPDLADGALRKVTTPTLERVADLAGAWFTQHLQPAVATKLG